jgi:hypothetical protein
LQQQLDDYEKSQEIWKDVDNVLKGDSDNIKDVVGYASDIKEKNPIEQDEYKTTLENQISEYKTWADSYKYSLDDSSISGIVGGVSTAVENIKTAIESINFSPTVNVVVNGTGTDNNGTDNNGTDNNGTDNNGTDNNGTDNNGTDNNGTDNNGGTTTNFGSTGDREPIIKPFEDTSNIYYTPDDVGDKIVGGDGKESVQTGYQAQSPWTSYQEAILNGGQLVGV